MNDVLRLLPVLFVSVIMNIGVGLYYNIGTQKINFNWSTLLNGVCKAVIVGGMFVGTAFCFEYTDLSSIGVTPTFIMTSAITLYVTKAIVSLGKILGVEINKNHTEG